MQINSVQCSARKNCETIPLIKNNTFLYTAKQIHAKRCIKRSSRTQSYTIQPTTLHHKSMQCRQRRTASEPSHEIGFGKMKCGTDGCSKTQFITDRIVVNHFLCFLILLAILLVYSPPSDDYIHKSKENSSPVTSMFIRRPQAAWYDSRRELHDDGDKNSRSFAAWLHASILNSSFTIQPRIRL